MIIKAKKIPKSHFYGCLYDDEPDERAVQCIEEGILPDIEVVHFDICVTGRERFERIRDAVIQAAKKKWPFATYEVTHGKPDTAPSVMPPARKIKRFVMKQLRRGR